LIVVISTERLEESTHAVTSWIRALGGACVRINGEDLSRKRFSIRIGALGTAAEIDIDGHVIACADVGVVWYRRGGLAVPELSGFTDAELEREVKAHLKGELQAVRTSFYDTLGHAYWLSHPDQRDLNKTAQLRVAARYGLRVPETLVTGDRETLLRFVADHPAAIVKSAGSGRFFRTGETSFGPYTATLTTAHIESLAEQAFPVLVQEAVPKAYEIRTFFLAGRCYSMAIFSQADPQTRVDFRRYNMERPNRTVPYALPSAVEASICDTMDALGLETGSLDLIRRPDGDFVFLEVNPVGQFGMVSGPCHYRLERRIAEFLIEKDVA
jgi:ATP-GRASP peptide maturase of grasp-with-spasm system